MIHSIGSYSEHNDESDDYKVAFLGTDIVVHDLNTDHADWAVFEFGLVNDLEHILEWAGIFEEGEDTQLR